MTNTIKIPVQAFNTNQRLLDNQLDQILALITTKTKSLADITKAYPKLTRVILDAATGKNTEISGTQLKAVQMALSMVDNLEKSIKESEEIVKALQQVQEPADKAAGDKPIHSFDFGNMKLGQIPMLIGE